MGNNCYKTPPDKWVSNKIFLLQLGILQNKKLVCVAAEAAETSLCSAVQTCPASSTELIQSAPELKWLLLLLQQVYFQTPLCLVQL